MNKSLWRIIAVAVFALFFILAWDDPVLVPGFHELPMLFRAAVFVIIGIVSGHCNG